MLKLAQGGVALSKQNHRLLSDVPVLQRRRGITPPLSELLCLANADALLNKHRRVVLSVHRVKHG